MFFNRDRIYLQYVQDVGRCIGTQIIPPKALEKVLIDIFPDTTSSRVKLSHSDIKANCVLNNLSWRSNIQFTI